MFAAAVVVVVVVKEVGMSCASAEGRRELPSFLIDGIDGYRYRRPRVM